MGQMGGARRLPVWFGVGEVLPILRKMCDWYNAMGAWWVRLGVKMLDLNRCLHLVAHFLPGFLKWP